MGIAVNRDCRDGDCSNGDHSDEDIRGADYRDGHRRGGDSRDGDHSDGGVSVHLARQMEKMLKGTISEKNGSQGCTEQAACQWGRGSGSILTSFGGGFWSRSVALLSLLSSLPALLVLDQKPLRGG